MKDFSARVARTEQFRFLLAGGLNTVLTYLLYLLLLPVAGYGFAYTINYAFGIVLSYFLNRLFVFRERARMDHLVTFPAAYLLPYLSGLLLLRILVGSVGVDARIAPVLAMVITVPMSFFLLRLVMRGRNPRG